jgi:hypothetical protein
MKNLKMFRTEKRNEKIVLLATKLLEEIKGKINIEDLKKIVINLDVWKDYEIVVCNLAKDFNNHCQLNNIDHEHSWAGDDGNIEEASILYGPNIKFGEHIDKWFSENGNITWSKCENTDADFDINSIHIVLIKEHSWSKWERQENYNEYYYKIVCYIPSDHPYKMDEKVQKFLEMFGNLK